MRKIKTRSQLAIKLPNVYDWLLRNNPNLLDTELASKRSKIVDSKIVENARKYTTKSSWFKERPGEYRRAKELGIWEECVSHMKPTYKVWTASLLLEDSAKYELRSEWETNSPTAAKHARKMGIYEECVKHMKVIRTKWTDETSIKDGAKHRSVGDWQKNSPGSYEYALRNELEFLHLFSTSKNKKRMVVSLSEGIVFESIFNAEKLLGITHGAISRSVKTGIRARGYHWAYYNEKIHGPIIKKGNKMYASKLIKRKK